MLALGVCLAPSPAFAEPERDPFLSHVDPGVLLRGFDEQYNPYSGQFLARFLTASLPGKGGHDLNVYLYYSTEVWNRTDESIVHSASLDTSDHAGGAGWQLHMGKVFNPGGIGSPNPISPDNPLLVMPDGSTRFLYQSLQFPGERITEDRWRYRWDSVQDGWELTTTDGTKYLFRTADGAFSTTMSGTVVAKCTKIADVNGNIITIDYQDGRIEDITDTYNRQVDFVYTTFGRIRYIRVKTSGVTRQQWEIKYSSALLTWGHPIGARTVYAVTELIPPEGNRWKFTTNSASIAKPSGAAILKKIELPTGGTIEYTYKGVDYDVGCQITPNIQRASLWTRKEAGRAVTPATYTYAYSNPGKSNAITTVSGPSSYQETHSLIGFGTHQLNDPNLFKIGRTASKTVVDGIQSAQETFTWAEGDTLSNDFRVSSAWGTNCGNSRALAPVKFVRPSSVIHTVTRDGTSYTTTTSGFDQYGNPTSVSEQGQVSRTTTLEYYYSTAKNILDGRSTLVQQVPGGIERTWYDTLGRLDRKNVNPSTKFATDGIDTDYVYHTTSSNLGNLHKIVVENGSNDGETRFLNYTFGKPELEEYENNPSSDVRVNRDVGPLGLVNWEDDGRQGSSFRTHFTYDDLGRVLTIDPPLGHTTTIVYAPDGSTATVTRSNRSQIYSFDGFGRLTSWQDVQRGDRRDLLYDDLGRLIQESFFRGGFAADRHVYDGAGRLKEVVHPDGALIRYTYLANNTVNVFDELNNLTVFEYESYGDPNERRLEKIIDAENGTWLYSYDPVKDLLTDIDAPGGTGADRSFTYETPGNFLDTERHPELSTDILYDYHPAGDRKERRKGGQSVLFEYDRIGRPSKIEASGTTDDVIYNYVGLDLQTEVRNSYADIDSTYDGAQRLLTRKTTIGAIGSRTVEFVWDNHDRLQEIKYPSGRRVTYHFNSKVQVTRVSTSGETDFVTLAQYKPAGDIEYMIYGNGVRTDWSYDTRFRPKDIIAGIHTLSIVPDNASNILTWTSDGVPRSFVYDDLHRLTSAVGPDGESIVYTYSATGNRETRTVNGVLEDYSYDNSMQRLTGVIGNGIDIAYGYDSHGRVTPAGNSVITYTRLDAVATATNPVQSYTYDGDNLRISKTDGIGVTTYYIRDNAGRILAEYDGTGSLLREHVYFLGRRIATVLPNGSRFYVQHDAQGSSWIVTDNNGQEVQPSQEYWPFGLPESLGPGQQAALGSSESVVQTLQAVWGAAQENPPSVSSSFSSFNDGFENACYMAWSKGVPSRCGDGLVFTPETCEDNCFGPLTCAGLGFDGGQLACNSCLVDATPCYLCGDGQVEGPEICDLQDLNGETCQTRGFFDGNLACLGDCTFDTSGCHNCGNSLIDPGEDCDGLNVNGQTCQSLGLGGGNLACSPSCTWDLSGCTTCGNAIVEPPEECDLNNLNGQSCQTLGFFTGQLACGVGCTFDLSGCSNCGNNRIDTGEVCDGTDVGNATCVSLGFDDGVLGCKPGCAAFETAGCFNYPDDTGARPHFTGKELDEELGWYYLGARYLDPAVGRFFVPDPAGLTLENPQSYNRYSYALNNPYKYVDPDGREPITLTAVAVGAAAGALEAVAFQVAINAISSEPLGQGVLREAGIGAGLGATGVGLVQVARKGFQLIRAARAAKAGVGVATVAARFRAFTASNFRVNLGRLTNKISQGVHAHHVFPRKFARQFRRLGIDVNDPRYGAWWRSSEHLRKATEYNMIWEEFLSSNPAREQVTDFARRLAADYGFKLNF